MKAYFLWLCKFITGLIVVFIVVPLVLIFIASIIGTCVSKKDAISNSANQIAVLELNGVILDSKELVDRLYKFSNDNRFKGIILKVNSPGGAVAPSQDIYNALSKLKEKKPIYAVMDSMAASGGYYVSAPCTKIYAQKGTLTGSIGVISQFINTKNLTDWLGVKITTIKSGKFKDVGAPNRDMTDEEKELLSKMSDGIHNQFIMDVANARNMDVDELKKIADGRVLSGAQAKNAGLIDEFGGVREAGEDLIKSLGIKGQTPVYYYPDDKLKEIKKFIESSVQKMNFLTQSNRLQMMYLY